MCILKSGTDDCQGSTCQQDDDMACCRYERKAICRRTGKGQDTGGTIHTQETNQSLRCNLALEQVANLAQMDLWEVFICSLFYMQRDMGEDDEVDSAD